MIVNLPGEHHRTGKDGYGERQKERLVLHRVGSKAVALVRFVNTDDETTYLGYPVGHHDPGFHDSATV